MLEIYNNQRAKLKKDFGIGGRKTKLKAADKILLMLEYYREYRTFAHIGFDYNVSESTAARTVEKVKKILIKSGKFSLPSKRKLYGDDVEFVVIDVTKMPIHRPKKTKN